MDLDLHRKNALEKQKEHRKFLGRLKVKPPKTLDADVLKIHQEVSAKTNCLSCANCCKTTGPLFTTKDVERISKFLKMKTKDFELRYLRRDEDEDLVLKTTPCSFLFEDDNTCSIYEVRPKACQEYPHTNRPKFTQINHLTLQNVLICPIAYEVVEGIQQRIEAAVKSKY